MHTFVHCIEAYVYIREKESEKNIMDHEKQQSRLQLRQHAHHHHRLQTGARSDQGGRGGEFSNNHAARIETQADTLNALTRHRQIHPSSMRARCDSCHVDTDFKSWRRWAQQRAEEEEEDDDDYDDGLAEIIKSRTRTQSHHHGYIRSATPTAAAGSPDGRRLDEW